MKLVLALALFALAKADFPAGSMKPRRFAVQSGAKNATARPGAIRQFLDHFNPTDPRTWEQRYFEVNEYYNGDGPIFLFLLGQLPADPSSFYNSFVEYLTEKFGALCFILEHRFYGESQPLPNLSTENLVYLSTDQALADVAYFILERSSSGRLKRSGAKWIVFGQEYAGTLAAWARLKYPHLVHAAVVDSAPFAAQPDFPQYYLAVEFLFDDHSGACVDHLSQALNKVYTLLSTITGQAKLASVFKLCRPINNSTSEPTSRDVASLYLGFLDWISYVALRSDNGPSIRDTCAVMLEEKSKLPVEKRLARALELVLEAAGQDCLSLWSYWDRVEALRNAEGEDRPRHYQQCTEFGWFANSADEPFRTPENAFTMSFFYKLCSDVYGFSYPNKLYHGIKRTNIAFGAADIAEVITNALFVYGSNDPWSVLRPFESNNPEVSIIYIEGVGGRVLSFPPSKNDNPEVLEAKSKVQNLISEWIEQ